ncbi:MAG: hypothetical protein EOO89_24770, partial [Pedobacter sp.]
MEEQIIYLAIQVTKEKTGLIGRWYAEADDKTIDGKLELKKGKQKYVAPAICKREIRNINLIQFQQLKEELGDLIIIAETIYPAIREQLRAMGLNYIDTAGNCYIQNQDWLFVLLDGFKVEPIVAPRRDKGFTKTGLILIFHFLNHEAYLNVTYRQMAKDYDIALGNINKIVTSLKAQGYLLPYNKKEHKIINKKKLVEEWITEYEQKLKPALLLGEFRFMNEFAKDWTKVPLNFQTQWGGEPAADLLTGYLKPARLTMYTLEKKMDLIKKYKLAPGQGNLRVYKKFWKFIDAEQDIVPPLLVYADLINTGDPRN